MKESLPYIPLNVNALLADDKVALMNTQEVGAYILLLCRAWQQERPGSLPNNDEWLARWTRLDLNQWLEIKKIVMNPFWFNESHPDGEWVQDRMVRDHGTISNTQQTKRALAQKAANARWGKKIPEDVEVETVESTVPDDALHMHDKSKKQKAKSQKVYWTIEDGFKNIQDKHRAAWKEAFPSVDIEQQMKEAHVWLVDHPDRAAKYQSYARYLTNWFKTSIKYANEAKGVIDGNHKRANQHDEVGLGKEVNIYGT
tara:strand:+ start:2494 stop:3261 length:768 start_codon:yes stop_codon:yes gene_type:complete